MNEQFIQSISINWNKVDENSYLREIEIIKTLKKIVFNSPITIFTGENGSGKSTMLEAIAISYGFNPEGGTKNYSFSTYDSHSLLHKSMIVSKGYRKPKWGYFFRAESFYNVATKEEEYSNNIYYSKKYHKKSHGESFISLFQDQFKENSVYLLDEPEAALSPQTQLALLVEIYECAKKGSQFIIVTHSPILLAIPGAQIIRFDGGEMKNCEYEDTESYKVTEMFINNRNQILKNLLGDY